MAPVRRKKVAQLALSLVSSDASFSESVCRSSWHGRCAFPESVLLFLVVLLHPRLRGMVPCCVSSALVFSVLCRTLPELLSCSVVRLSYSACCRENAGSLLNMALKRGAVSQQTIFYYPGHFVRMQPVHLRSSGVRRRLLWKSCVSGEPRPGGEDRVTCFLPSPSPFPLYK